MDLSPLSKVIPSWGAPTLEGFDLDQLQDGQRLKSSSRQYVRFYEKKELQIYATEAKINAITGSSTPTKHATREVTRLYVNIVTPGDKNTVDDYAEDFHKREHWREYKAFRDGRSAPLGKSIEECTYVAPNISTELKYHGVHTEEQLADSSDLLCGQIANGFELRDYARAVVKANSENGNLAQVNALRGELERSNALLAKMQEQIDALKKPDVIVEDLEPKKSRGMPKGGWPKKETQTETIGE